MKKKILLGLLVIISLFTITGCGQNGNSGKTYSLGDTVKTDIISFELIAGEFTYALVNTNGDEFAMPKEYNAEDDNNNPYVAAKGHTLAAFTFCVENLDRASIDIGGSFNSEFGSITYEKENYGINNDSEVVFKATSEDNLNWESYSYDNILLQAGEKKYFRAYIDIPTDVEKLDDTMELTIYLPTSEDKTEAFTFVISEDDRNNYKDDEITEDIAIKNLDKKVVQEYFNNHLVDYSIMNSDEIKSSVESRKLNVIEIGGGGIWKGSFTFQTSGRIYEKSDNGYAVGYTNNRTWGISDNKLTLSWVNGNKETISTICEVRKIQDGAYLLLDNGEIFGILYE